MTQATARKARMRRTASDAEQIREQAPEEHASGIALAVPSATEVGRADDPAEVAADRMADSVLSRLAPADPDAGTGQGQPQPARRSGARRRWARRSAPRVDPSTRPVSKLSSRHVARGDVCRQACSRGWNPDSVRASPMSACTTTNARPPSLGTSRRKPSPPDRTSSWGRQRLVRRRREEIGCSAHELAHVVQGGNAAHRWPFDSKDKDPAEEQRKADEKAKKKDDKKKQKAQDKQVKADTKQTVKESKKALTVEEGRLKGERKVGKEDRAGISANIASDTTTLVGQKDTKGNDLVVQSGDAKKDLDLRFKVNLEFEEKLFAQYRTKTPVAEAATKAYDEAWMKCPDPEVRAVRPPRETEAWNDSSPR